MAFLKILDNESIFDVLLRGGSNSENLVSVLQLNNLSFADTLPIVKKDPYLVIASNSYNFRLTGDYTNVFIEGEYFIFNNEKYLIASVSFVGFINSTIVSTDTFPFTIGETYTVYSTTTGVLKDALVYLEVNPVSFTSEVSITTEEEVNTTASINGLDGQSIFDIALMTYGSTEFLIKLLQDSNIDSINTGSVYGYSFTYDKNLISDVAVYNHMIKNNIVYGTL